MTKLKEVLEGRDLDYLVIHHMEPDHSGAIETIIDLYPNVKLCLLYTSPSPRDRQKYRMPSSA